MLGFGDASGGEHSGNARLPRVGASVVQLSKATDALHCGANLNLGADEAQTVNRGEVSALVAALKLYDRDVRTIFATDNLPVLKGFVVRFCGSVLPSMAYGKGRSATVSSTPICGLKLRRPGSLLASFTLIRCLIHSVRIALGMAKRKLCGKLTRTGMVLTVMAVLGGLQLANYYLKTKTMNLTATTQVVHWASLSK